MNAYTILSYLTRYHYLEERDDLIESYVYLNWSLCSLEEMKIELIRAREYEDQHHNYMIIINDRLEIVYELDS